MANPEHFKILQQGLGTWNKWRQDWPYVSPDLSRLNLAGIKLRDARMRQANFRGAVLASADLVRCDLTTANLDQADLRGALLGGATLTSASLRRARLGQTKLYGTNLAGANLNESDFGAAHFQGVNLNGANLSSANLTGAIVQSTLFANVDLSTVRGLESIFHIGPSTIGLDTVYRSKGNIPEGFLRGAGVPDDFIVYIESLVGKPTEYYSCFISYSTKDQEFADQLYADLQANGVRCWFAPHDVRAGEKLHEQIDRAIRLHEKLLLILSPYSMNSEWVKTEITKGRKREARERMQVLFPIRLCSYETLRDWECFDADAGKDSAREIREYFIPDFSTWKDAASYQEALRRLLRDLKAHESQSPQIARP